jgi:chorismate dehydratase
LSGYGREPMFPVANAGSFLHRGIRLPRHQNRAGVIYRLATVSFLNCLPLVDYFATPEGAARAALTSALPSRLAALLAAGQADVALLPTAEILRGQAAGLIGASGIACRGAVDSVKFYHRGPLDRLRHVAVDRGSRTSVALLRILLAEVAGVAPALHRSRARAPGGCRRLTRAFW